MAAKSRGKPNPAQMLMTGTPMRMEPAKSSRRRKKPRSIVIGTVNSTEEFAGGFVDFLRENAVVGVAIGFVIGLQAQALMKQLIASFIDPLFTLFFGQALNQRSFTITIHDRSVVFAWGAFAYSLISFLFVLGVIYVIYRLFKLDRLEKSKEDK